MDSSNNQSIFWIYSVYLSGIWSEFINTYVLFISFLIKEYTSPIYINKYKIDMELSIQNTSLNASTKQQIHISYLQHLSDKLPKPSKNSPNNFLVTDLTHIAITNPNMATLCQFIQSNHKNSEKVFVFYHDFIHGVGQASILASIINNHNNKNGLPLYTKICVSSASQEPDTLLRFIECLKNQHKFAENIILDMYGLHGLQIQPYLHAIAANKLKSNVVIYAHPNQQATISQIFENIWYEEILYSYETPYQISSHDLLPQLATFLEENAKHEEQDIQDIVIFHNNSQQYINELNHLIRIKSLHKYCRIVHAQDLQIKADQREEENNGCKVIIAENTAQLYHFVQKTRTNLERVYLILDYGEDHLIYFDYDSTCMIEDFREASASERNRRINLIKGKIFHYIHGLQVSLTCQRTESFEIESQKEHDLGNYVFLMKYLNLEKCLPKFSLFTQKSLAYLSTVLKEITPEILRTLILPNTHLFMTALMHSIGNPIQNSKPQFQQLLALAFSLWNSQNLQERQKISGNDESYFNEVAYDTINFKTSNTQVNYKKPCSMWMQSGYLQASLDLTTKINMLLLKNAENPDFDIMPYHQKFQFSESAYKEIKARFNEFKEVYGIKSNILDDHQITEAQFIELLEYLVEKQRQSVRFFSGSRRLGYFQKGKKTGRLLSKQSLTVQLNERPSFLFLMRMIIGKDEETEIYLSNNITDEIMLTSYGSLGNESKQSFGEAEIEFHNVSSSVINHLTKYNRIQLDNFEREHECSIQINEDIGMVGIQCSKLKEHSIRKIFNQLIDNLKEMFHKESKVFNHSKTLKIVLGSGAQVQDLIIKENDEQDFKIIDLALLKNVAKQATLEDLKDLFDEFVHLKEITLLQKQNHKQAILNFYSHHDYRKFYQYFNGCEYLGSVMYVDSYHPINKIYTEEKYLLFEWNAWKSTGEAFVQFESEVAAKFAEKDLRLNNKIDEATVEVIRSDRTLYISKMNPITDEKFLFNLFIPHGRITKIEIKRSHFSETSQNSTTVSQAITRIFKGDQVRFTVGDIIKGKNGHRSAKISFQQQQYMKEAYFVFNQITGSLGKGRLYANIYYTYPISINQSDNKYIGTYRSILEEISELLNRPQMLELEIIKQANGSWIIVKSTEEAEMQIIKTMLFDALRGKKLNLSHEDHTKLMTQFALKSIQELQKKYPCKITPDFNTKQIKGVGRSNVLAMVEKEINTKLIKSFVCSVQLYNKTYRYIEKNLLEIKEKIDSSSLDKVELESITKSIVMVGKIDCIEKSKEKLGNILFTLGKSNQKNQDQQTCGICAEPHNHPYKLQACGHKFCFECLEQSIQIGSKDINLYPLKCPECLEKIYICDLSNIIPPQNWTSVLLIALNYFIGMSPQKYIYCFTAQCLQINTIQLKSWFRCRQCKKGYCLKCRGQYHPGMSCQQARYGSDRMFDDFMKSIGGRICANKSCGAPIWRISGCFKVQCTKCKACMCFKCPQKQMKAYKTPAQTYDHLNKVHGGCF